MFCCSLYIHSKSTRRKPNQNVHLFFTGTEDFINCVRQEAIQLVDNVLEQSLIMVNSNSESEHFAITCDVNGLDLIKSPTIESMSGRSFDDNFSMHDDEIDVVHNNNTALNVNIHSSSNNNIHNITPQTIQTECIEHNILLSDKKSPTALNEHIERSQLDIDDEDPLDSSQCQREFDKAMKQINPNELSDLQREFSKISWDDSASATTADVGVLTPDNDIQDIPKGDNDYAF